MVSIKQHCLAVLVAALAMTSAGCQLIPDRGLSGPASNLVQTGLNVEPRVRFGCYPTATLGTVFLGENLGTHKYHYSLREKDGVAYTCRAGHIDITHLRIAADWTAYLASESFKHLMSNDAHFSYRFAVDRSTDHVHLSYPENWSHLSEDERATIAEEVAMAMGPYLAFTMTTWHEILTWFGFKCVGFATEFPSAFSWEDSYSNLLGTLIASRALQDTQHSYNQAITIALNEEMERLGMQPARVARRASAQVKGEWFTGSALVFVDVRRRNFDIGLNDGTITPTLLDGVDACEDVEPVSYPVPSLDVLTKHGFSLKVEIEPHEWERDAILAVAYPDPEQRSRRIDPAIHFARIMDHIRRDAVRRYGHQVYAQGRASAYGTEANSP